MSTPEAKLAQIKEENKRFRIARNKGDITAEEYNQAMAYQKQKEQEILESQTTSPLPKQSWVEGDWKPVEEKAAPKQTSVPLPSTGKYVEGDWQPVEEATPEQQEIIREKTEAIRFYGDLGKPELGLRYPVPDIEEGYVVVGVEEVTPTRTHPIMSARDVSPEPYLEFAVVKKTPASLAEQIMDFSPGMFGLSIAEQITGRPITSKQREIMRQYDIYVTGKSTEVVAGLVATFESPIYSIGTLVGVKDLPSPPATAMGGMIGTGVTSVLAGRYVETEEMRYVQEHPAYAMGSLMGDILIGYAIGKGVEKVYRIAVPKSVQFKLSSTTYHITQSVKQSRVGVSTSKFITWLKYTEPIHTIRQVPERVATWFAKRGYIGTMEAQLGWDVVEKPVVTGFTRAFPTDVVYTAGTYKTYPGFELWATVAEPHKYAGYPVIRPMSVATYSTLRRGMETWIFEGGQVIPEQVPNVAKELSSWETFSGTVEAHRYAGYPVFHGQVVGVKLVKEPSAFDQIRKGIERGMFPKMGGLSAVQVPLYAKPVYDPATMLRYRTDYDVTVSSVVSQPSPIVQVKRTAPQITIPFANLVTTPDVVELLWEEEKLKYRELDFVTQAERAIPVAVQKPALETVQRQLVIPTYYMPTPEIPSPTIPDIPYPSYPPPTRPSPTFPSFPTIPGVDSRSWGGDLFKFSIPQTKGTRKYLWEFPVVGPKEFMKDWF